MSSISQQLSNFQQPPIFQSEKKFPSPSVHNWVLEDCEINLIKTSQGLGYEIIKEGIVTIQKEIGNPENKSLDERIERIKKCCPILNPNGDVIFPYLYNTWEIPGFEISLVCGSDDLIWNVFNSITKQRHIFEFKEFTSPSSNCHPQTRDRIEKIRENAFLNPEYIWTLLNEFKIVGIEDTTDRFWSHVAVNGVLSCAGAIALTTTVVFTGIVAVPLIAIGIAAVPMSFAAVDFVKDQRNRDRIANSFKWIKESSLKNKLVVKIEPLSAPSLFDSRVLVSKFTWAVVLVTTASSSDYSIEALRDNHTEIIIEGINDRFFSDTPFLGSSVAIGEKFTYQAHFTGARIKYKLIPESHLVCKTRTEIWMRPCDKVKTLIMNITKSSTPNFELAGNDALHAKGAHSCFTWARDQIKAADIFLEKSRFGKFFTYPKSYTEKPEYYLKRSVEVQI